MKILKYLKTLLGKATSTTHVKYYNSINDILLFNWFECLDGNYQYARLSGYEEKATLEDVKAWESIYATYVSEYGLNQLYKEYLKVARKIAILQADYIEKGVKYNLTQIEVLEEKKKGIQDQMNKGVSRDSVMVYLSKYMGFRLNPKEMTAKEYFTLIKEYERNN